MRDIPLKSMEEIMRCSTDFRISDGAKIELKKLVENKLNEISFKAITYAKHAKRNTLMSDDIKLAIKEIDQKHKEDY